MARPCTIDTNQILDAARELFLERGIDVPTAEIARRAGVSEGSIFRRFPTKQSLFLSAMGLDEPPPFIPWLCDRAGKGDVADNLRYVVREGIAFFLQKMPRIMLVWSSREDHPSTVFQQMGPCSGPRRVLQTLTDYIAEETRLGRLHCDDPEVVARTLMGSITSFALLETLGVRLRPELDSEAYGAVLVQTLWRGIAPDGE